MRNWLHALRGLFQARKNKASLLQMNRLAGLQHDAKQRRAEYTAETSRADLGEDPSSSRSLLVKKMKEAEAAYAIALQVWENQASRQRSH